MNAMRGRVRGGCIEIDTPLPEGAEVIVLARGDEEAFELNDMQLHELERRMNEAWMEQANHGLTPDEEEGLIRALDSLQAGHGVAHAEARARLLRCARP